MLATLVIGLREGLEAALIVGIIAAFLRRNGQRLTAMWVGVIVAVVFSVGVGVALELVSASLPQAQQEGMESIIGAIAIVFVTGMIVWMKTHAKAMRRELESSATSALRDGTAWALAGMAFLAVLKEGFETSVFLLATFQASTNTLLAATGALIGILISVGVGVAIYQGGIRLNLGRFFTITGVFLVFVAAGLVVSMLRTAHEAGWIAIGQQKTFDLSWLAPNGSIQAALVTGVLGIPADPRVIEVLGWVLYLIPVLLYCLWPASRRPSVAQVPTLKLSIAAALGAAALVLAVAVPLAHEPAVQQRAPLAGGGTASLAANGHGAQLLVQRTGDRERISFAASDRSQAQHAGVAAVRWHRSETVTPSGHPASIGIEDLLALEGGRLPVGVNAQTNPGPFSASWTQRVDRSVWSVDGALLDARSAATTALTISGGGLSSPRTFSLPRGTAANWAVASSHVAAVSVAAAASAIQAGEALLWKLYLPIVLALAALILAGTALRARRRLRVTHTAEPPAATPSVPTSTTAEPTRSTSYAAK